MNSPAKITVFTSTRDLCKAYTLETAGSLRSEVAAHMTDGVYQVVGVPDPAALAEVVTGLKHTQAFSGSVPMLGGDSGRIVTAAQAAANPDALTRTKRGFSWADDGPALLTLDHDPAEGAPPLSVEDFWDLCLLVAPALADVQALGWSSASSHIWNAETEEEIRGSKGLRVWLWAGTGTDVPAMLAALEDRFWLAGLGYCKVSASGAVLERTPIDPSMAQPARLDFAAGAKCLPPLEQRRGSPVVLGGTGLLDLKRDFPPLSVAEVAAIATAKREARESVREEAEAAKAKHRAAHLREGVARLVGEGVPAADAEGQMRQCLDSLDRGVLTGAFVLRVVHDDGRREQVSVAHVLSHSKQYDKACCLVPGNEGHRGGAADAILYLNQASPSLFSLDDGGQIFTLRRALVTVPWARGGRGDSVPQIAAFLAAEPDVFATDAGPVQNVDGHNVALGVHQIQLICDQRLILAEPAAGGKTVLRNLPKEDAALVLAELKSYGRAHGMKHLTLTHDLPCFTPTGRLIAQGGWDRDSGVLMALPPDYLPNIPAAPSHDEVRKALAVIARPFLSYTWATPDDAAGAMSGALAAVCRPLLDKAPMVAADANTQGSGKTYFVLALGSIVSGRFEAVTPFSAQSDDETRKRVMAGVLAGSRFTAIDNVTGYWDSASLSGLLTSGRVSDRKLGASENIDAECRALITATGNNMRLSADLSRRTVLCRINGGAKPTERQHDFNPVDVALRDRVAIAEAACVLWRAYFAAGAPKIAGNDAGGFAQWCTLCREPLLWATAEGLTDRLPWVLGDPAASMLRSPENSDPLIEALGQLLWAINELKGTDEFTAKHMLTWYQRGLSLGAANDDPTVTVKEAVDALTFGKGATSALVVGRLLQSNREKFVDGRCVTVRRDTAANSSKFRVKRAP